MNLNGRVLFKSRSNRIISGVCGGLGDYFGIDANLVRLIMVILGCLGVGIVLYIIAAIILPEH